MLSALLPVHNMKNLSKPPPTYFNILLKSHLFNYRSYKENL